jgi:hypothetical protein
MPDAIPLRPAAAASVAPNASDAPRDHAAGGRPVSLALAVEPLLVDTERAAAACGIGRATWFRLKSAGKTPAPVKLRGRVLYRVEDLRLWVSWGCPPRKDFEARRAAVISAGRPSGG